MVFFKVAVARLATMFAVFRLFNLTCSHRTISDITGSLLLLLVFSWLALVFAFSALFTHIRSVAAPAIVLTRPAFVFAFSNRAYVSHVWKYNPVG